MESIPLEEDLDNVDIGIGCCSNHQAATLGLLREMKYTSEEPNSVTSKQPGRKVRLAAIMSSSLLLRPKKYLTASHTESLSSDDEKIGGGIEDSQTDCDSIAGCLSTPQAVQSMGDEYFGQGPCPELLSMPSLLDDSDNIHSQDKGGTATTCSESSPLTPSEVDSIAREVGLNAHEYLEECFYTEVSVLNREKFNSIPEVTKSDFKIKGHLGKGSFSDVFDVVCEGGQLFDAKMSNTISGGTQLNRRRSTRGRRLTISSSITMALLARPPQCNDRQLAFAMKCLRPQIRSDIDEFNIGAEDLVHETAILANLNHHHIIKLHGRASGNLTDAFVLNDGYFILLDKLNETLNDRINVWKRTECILQGPTIKQLEVAHSIADAMAYLHSKKVVFRDLKPDNVGFDYKGVLKLFDFGFATGVPEKDETNPAGFLYDRCGTPRYMAPEVGLSIGYGTKADVYSFGILLWEMCALAKPFSSITSSSEFERIVFMGGKRPTIDNRWPATIEEFISSCWSTTPSKRPTMLDIKSSLSLKISKTPGEDEAPMKTVRSRMTRRRSGFR